MLLLTWSASPKPNPRLPLLHIFFDFSIQSFLIIVAERIMVDSLSSSASIDVNYSAVSIANKSLNARASSQNYSRQPGRSQENDLICSSGVSSLKPSIQYLDISQTPLSIYPLGVHSQRDPLYIRTKRQTALLVSEAKPLSTSSSSNNFGHLFLEPLKPPDRPMLNPGK